MPKGVQILIGEVSQLYPIVSPSFRFTPFFFRFLLSRKIIFYRLNLTPKKFVHTKICLHLSKTNIVFVLHAVVIFLKDFINGAIKDPFYLYSHIKWQQEMYDNNKNKREKRFYRHLPNRSCVFFAFNIPIGGSWEVWQKLFIGQLRVLFIYGNFSLC